MRVVLRCTTGANGVQSVMTIGISTTLGLSVACLVYPLQRVPGATLISAKELAQSFSTMWHVMVMNTALPTVDTEAGIATTVGTGLMPELPAVIVSQPKLRARVSLINLLDLT